MVDSSPQTPAAPPVVPPAKPASVLVSKPLAIVHALLLIATVAVGGFAIYQHFHDSTPPSPAPPKPPDPSKPASGPVAKVSGLYFPLAGPAVRGSAGAPLGFIRVSAEQSTSSKPIKWKTRGPAPLSLTVISPDGGLGSSIVEAYPTVPGTYRIHGIARGTAKGEADADVDSYEVEVGDPTPPSPDPKPDPKPDPNPKPPAPPDTPPDPSLDPIFYKLGLVYSKTLASTYADSLESGASMLASGQSLSAAMAGISKQWDSGRTAAFEKALTPEFSKIIPESTKDADITAAQKDAMAKACRSLAAGLRK